MVQNVGKFSHIAVTPDEEDDIVIEAGMRARSESGAAHQADGEAQSAPDGADANEAAEGAFDGEGGEAAGARASEAPDARDAAAPEAQATGSPGPADSAGDLQAAPQVRTKAKRGDYRETTMEDLEGTSMSAMQKVIVALALLFVVVAVVYYFFLRG